MKKFVVIDSIGTWGIENGRKVIDCTVKSCKVIAEANTAEELAPLTSANVIYCADGTWHSHAIRTRAQARRWYCV